MINPVNIRTGSDNLTKPSVLIAVLITTIGLALLIVTGGVKAISVLLLLPFLLIYLNRVFVSPKVGVYGVIIYGFLVNGLSRYIKSIPFGLGIDGMLVIVFLAIFFYSFKNKIPWKYAAKDITLLAVLWFGLTLLQLLNPEAQSKTAWFYAMRGISLYFLLLIPLVLILLNSKKDLHWFLYIWGIFTVLASVKGFIQLNIGLDPFEKAWLNAGAANTHLLWGKLRVFSFFSDAGQFGAAQAHVAIVSTIIFIHSKKLKERIFFGVVAILGYYGLFVSGTRGAISIPFAGFFLYLILTRNIKIITLGIIMAIGVFVFFKFTTIGSGIYAINRMRTAFDPNDPSLQVRLRNQRILKAYLATRPLGGGIGSVGYWGQRFTPHTFLANMPTDSWYVRVWAEQGIVGLSFHIFVLVYILGRGAYLSMFKVRDDWLQIRLFALASGIFGVMVASYGNPILGQLPTATVLYPSMAFLFLAKEMDREDDKLINDENNEQNNHNQIT